MAPALGQIEDDARRAENVARVDEGGAHAAGEIERLAIGGLATEVIEGLEAIEFGIERLGGAIAPMMARVASRTAAGLLLLQMR